MTPLEATDIERLRELLAKATPGPWRKFTSRYGNTTIAIMKGDQPAYDDRGYHVERWPEIIGWPGFDASDEPKGKRHANARLIVAAVNALPALLETATRVKVLEENLASATDLLRLLVAYDDEAKPNGIQDCVDNDGQPYQSAAMAGLVTHARMIAAPFDMAQALRDIGGGGMTTARSALTASEDDRGSKGEARG